MYAMWFDGSCPQCRIDDKSVTMRPSMSRMWECPSCHLQVSTNCDQKCALVMRSKGKGNFNTDPAISVTMIPNPRERALMEDNQGNPGAFIITKEQFSAYIGSGGG